MRALRHVVALAFLLMLASCVVIFDTDALDEGCSAGQKMCDGVCVSKTDPGYGCGRTTCAPCYLEHVKDEKCGGDGDCAVGVCDGLYSNCDAVNANGCEVNLETSNENCGRCGRNCTELFPNKPNVATTDCADQNCVVGTCEEGYRDCDGDFSNGCEVDRLTDPDNCGVCNNQCEDGQTCVSGSCVPE